jgi:hypothetical protein
MAMEVEQQSVVVTDESPSVNVEAGGNASAIVIKGKDLDALSDDPDELSNELTAWPDPRPDRTAGRFTSTASPAGNCRPSRRFARFASTRIRFPRSSTGSATGASRFSPSREPTSCMASSSCRATTSSFNTGNPFTKSFRRTTATSSTAQ